MAKEIQVSILIPLFNEVESIDHLLSELQRIQNELPFSSGLILIDDASTDKTPTRLHTASGAFKFKTITLNKNSGRASAVVTLTVGRFFCS